MCGTGSALGAMPLPLSGGADDSRELTSDILTLCRAAGFAASGVARAEKSERAEAFARWLDDGQHGEMDWLKTHVSQRLDPSVKLPGARSVICVADRYDAELSTASPSFSGRVARYARGEDYHRVLKRRLHEIADVLRQRFPGALFTVCIDTAPVLERSVAVSAGLGFVAKNTMLIRPGLGSYFFLGEIITTLKLHVDAAQEISDHCGTCTRCIDACPTDALTPYALDARKCISYHTIEQRSAIDEHFHEAIGDWIFGCDICQEVCPHNNPLHVNSTEPVALEYGPRHASFDLLEVLNWTPADRQTAFARSALKRAKLWMMKRNALIAAGNALAAMSHERLLGRVHAIAGDKNEHPVVRQTARSVLNRLGLRG